MNERSSKPQSLPSGARYPSHRAPQLWFWVTLFWCALAVQAPLLGQSQEGNRDEVVALQVAEQDAIQNERERLLLSAWLESTPEEREIMQSLVQEGRDPRRSRSRPLPLQSVSRALREHHNPGQRDEFGGWFDLLDALTLRVRPGLFAARKEGRGEPMIVTIQCAWDPGFGGNQDQRVDASLVWKSPAGDEVIARTEPVNARILHGSFDMYIRPPASKAMTWLLTLELSTPRGLVRSFPIPVECVDDLTGSLERLASPTASKSEALRQTLLGRVLRLGQHGIRSAQALPLGDLIGIYEQSGETLLSKPETLGVIDGARLGNPGQIYLEWAASLPPKCTLVLLVDEREAATDLLGGPVGRLWKDLASASGARLIAGHVPLSATDAGPLVRLVESLKTGNEELPILVVARGNSGRVLPGLLSRRPCKGLDGLILSETIAASAPVGETLSIPCLRVEMDVEMDKVVQSRLGSEAVRRAHVAIPRPAPLALPEALTAIQNWLKTF